ncbi:MAG: glycosyltransferase [Gammaproteobacteria bacterium]|nr:MAG: glycosyltransferase [Gammaproteobacteria bacterium]RKZ74224.1 MAG: glycosyltransferase [Gammaproteobacteria bacterium]
MKKTISSISIIIPVYNEEGNLSLLYESLVSTFATMDYNYEMIFVDDGSNDTSFSLLEQLAQQNTNVKVIRFTRNYGQTAALAAGIDHAQGDAVVFMDADLQNDPTDIPMMLAKLNEGYDVVSGWRKDRQDTWLTRILPSKIANWVISKVTKVHLHDYGCTLKVYRRQVLNGYHLYGEMHRFLPAFAAQVGAKIVEVPVKHHPRRYGQSKYGLGRTGKVILDLFTVKFLNHYAQHPIYLFGSVGIVLVLLSFLLLSYLLVGKFFYGLSMIRSPLLLMSSMFVILGVQSIFLGLISELLVRTYHESQDKPTYHVSQILNINTIK